jgi:mRNA interferase MazF
VDPLNSSKADLVIVLPITSRRKYVRPTHIPVDPPEGGPTLPSAILCDQIRTVSTDRLVRRMGAAEPATRARVEPTVRALLGL